MKRDCRARDQHLRRKRTEGITTSPKNQKRRSLSVHVGVYTHPGGTRKQCKRATRLGCWHVPESYVLTVCKRSISDPAHTSGCLCSPRATHVGRQQRRRRTGTCSGTRRTVEPPDRKKTTRAAKISKRKPNERHHAGHHLKKTCTNRTKKKRETGYLPVWTRSREVRVNSTRTYPTRRIPPVPGPRAPGRGSREGVPCTELAPAAEQDGTDNFTLQHEKEHRLGIEPTARAPRVTTNRPGDQWATNCSR